MVIACLGDSLTEGDYGVFGKSGIGNVHEKNYPYFLQQTTGATVKNFGRCGFTATSYRAYYQTGAVDLTDADLVIVMLGSNGGLDPEHADAPGNADYQALIDACRQDAPKAQIVLCTPPHATVNPQMSNCGYAGQVQAAVTFVRQYAAQVSLPVIDVFHCPAFTDEAEPVMQPNDGLHFCETGYRVMAAYIEKNLRSLFPRLFV